MKYFDPSEGACSKTYKCPTEAEKKAAEEKAAKEKAAKEEAAKEKVAKEKAEKEKAVKAAVLEAAKKVQSVQSAPANCKDQLAYVTKWEYTGTLSNANCQRQVNVLTL